MTDGMIKGTGNSRYLRSVANAMALYPTHEALMEALAAGTFPIDLNGINPAGWDVVGNKLDKATLLTDALCTALGLATTATPTQAMDKLRQLVGTAQTGVDNGVKVVTGTYKGNGNSGANSPNSLTFSFVPAIVVVSSIDSNNGISLAFLSRFWAGLATRTSSVTVSSTAKSINLLAVNTSGTTITWYCTPLNSEYSTTAKEVQQNKSGQLYNYVAIG